MDKAQKLAEYLHRDYCVNRVHGFGECLWEDEKNAKHPWEQKEHRKWLRDANFLTQFICLNDIGT
jgi:hypothetical protein